MPGNAKKKPESKKGQQSPEKDPRPEKKGPRSSEVKVKDLKALFRTRGVI